MTAARMTGDLAVLVWPVARLGEALESLATHSRLPMRTTEVLTPPAGIEANDQPLREWLEAAARWLDLEAQPAETPYGDFEWQVRAMGPALVRVHGFGFLAILRGKRGSVNVLGPDGCKHRIAPSTIRSALSSEMEAPVAAQVQELLDRAGVPKPKQARARDVILRERLSAARICGIWLLRVPPSASFRHQLLRARVPQRLLALAGAHAIQYVLWMLAWWVVGTSALRGRAEPGWLLVWALLLLTLVPLRVLITWLQGLVAIGAGALLKQRLFYGALRLEPDNIRHQGAGQLLGRVIECEVVEALALSGGFLALVAAIELAIAAVVISLGAGGTLQVLMLLGWIAIAALLAREYLRRNRTWTDVRLAMTHELVESMVGHRTRLAQLPPDQWHDGEDEALNQYLKTSKALDNSTAALIAIVPRGWLIVGLLALAPAFVCGPGSPAQLAVAIGGMLLAYRALKRLTSGVWQLAGAAVAWERVAVLYRAAARPEARGLPDLACAPRAAGDSAAVIEARDLVFRYRDRAQPVLRGCTLRIADGERLVLEGASGGGKSTLVSLLVGLRAPESGVLLADGLDRQTLGPVGWRKRIAAAPQFHENHVLTETFAFNLFMGRRRAPGPRDFEEAEAICHELGLGELLQRMPAGMLQMVGESGWQLSHGERSRVYIARALLQDPDVVVLDESFAALDPENLRRAVACVVKRARALLVIAHR